MEETPFQAWESTLWSTILRAQDRSAEALETLARRYWKPLYFYLRSKVRDRETAQDLTQDFFLYLIDKDLLQRVGPARGSFRGFLRAVADRFLSDQRDRERAAKRGGDRKRIPLDFAQADTEFVAEESPERAYERAWADETLARVLERLRSERPDWSEIFRLRFGFKGEAASYGQIAEKLGMAETDVANALHRAKQRFRELLKEEIRPSVSSPEERETELRFFHSIF